MSHFGALLSGLSKGNGDARHHGGREGGVPALRDVLQHPLQQPESLLRGVGGLHPSLSVCQPPGRKVRLGHERVPCTFCGWARRVHHLPLPSSRLPMFNSRKADVNTNPRFAVPQIHDSQWTDFQKLPRFANGIHPTHPRVTASRHPTNPRSTVDRHPGAVPSGDGSIVGFGRPQVRRIRDLWRQSCSSIMRHVRAGRPPRPTSRTVTHGWHCGFG